MQSTHKSNLPHDWVMSLRRGAESENSPLLREDDHTITVHPRWVIVSDNTIRGLLEETRTIREPRVFSVRVARARSRRSQA